MSKFTTLLKVEMRSGNYKKELIKAESLNDEIMPISARVNGISEARRELSLIVKK